MDNFNREQYQIYNSHKPIVIGIFGRGKGKTHVGIQKAVDTDGIFITFSSECKKQYMKEYNYKDVYTSHEFFNLRGVSIKNKTVIIDEIDLMKLSDQQIRSVLHNIDIKQFIILGTPSTLNAKVQPINKNGNTELHIEFESTLLQLYFNLRNSDKVDCIIASSNYIPENSKNYLTVDEYQCSFLKQV
jgi:hypothetical protein